MCFIHRESNPISSCHLNFTHFHLISNIAPSPQNAELYVALAWDMSYQIESLSVPVHMDFEILLMEKDVSFCLVLIKGLSAFNIPSNLHLTITLLAIEWPRAQLFQVKKIVFCVLLLFVTRYMSSTFPKSTYV